MYSRTDEFEVNRCLNGEVNVLSCMIDNSNDLPLKILLVDCLMLFELDHCMTNFMNIELEKVVISRLDRVYESTLVHNSSVVQTIKIDRDRIILIFTVSTWFPLKSVTLLSRGLFCM